MVNIYSNKVKVKVISMLNSENMLEMDYCDIIVSSFSGKFKINS